MSVRKTPPTARIVSEGAGRFRIEGDINFDSVMPLLHRSRALFRDEERIRLDFAGVVRINSAGLALLIEWMKEARQGSYLLEVSHLPVRLLAMIRICGVEDLIRTITHQDEKHGE